MKVPFKIIKLSGVLFIIIASLVTATALFLPNLLDLNSYRGEIVSLLQQNLRRPVSFSSGAFRWRLSPSFEFRDFVIREPDGSRDFVSGSKITVELALLPLLGKKIELKSVILSDPRIAISRDAAGRLNLDDLLKRDKGEDKPALKKIRIKNGTIIWSDQANPNKPIDALFQKVELAADGLERGGKSHFKLDARLLPLSGVLTELSLSGNMVLPTADKSLLETVISADLNLKQGEISRFWDYFGRFVPFAATGGRVDLTTSFKGKPGHFSTRGKVTVQGATVNWPKVFHSTLSPRSLQLEYSANLSESLIDLGSLEFNLDGFKLSGSAQIRDYKSGDPHIIAKASTPASFKYEDVRTYIPYGIIESSTSDYIENKIKSGIFKLDTATLDGRISQITHMEIEKNSNILYLRAPVEKGVLSYGSQAPAFNNIKGVMELKGKNFNLVGMSGAFGTSPFRLDGSITEYNSHIPSDFPFKAEFIAQKQEVLWLAKTAGIPEIDYSSSSPLRLSGSGHYSAYRLAGDWDLKNASYIIPGYVNKPQSMPHSLSFSSVIGAKSTRISSFNYSLNPLVISGDGLIGYDETPHLEFDIKTNRFMLNESLPVLALSKKYHPQGNLQAHIKGKGNPWDMSDMDFHGKIELSQFSFQPYESFKPLSGINGLVNFRNNSLETTSINVTYGSSALTLKGGIKSLHNPEGDLLISSPRLFLRDLNVPEYRTGDSIREFNAALTVKKDSLQLNRVSGLLNSSDFTLNGVYHGGRTPGATVAVTSSKFNLDDLRVFSGSAKNRENVESSRGMEIKLRMDVENGTLGKLAFNKLHVAAEQQNGIVYLENLTAGLLGGKLAAKGRIAPDAVLGDRYDLTLDLVKTDAEKLFAILDISREATGTLSVHGDLTARGNSLLDLKKSALGNIRLTMNDGTLRRFSAISKLFSILNVSQLLKLRLPDMASGGMPYNSIKGSISVKDGVMGTEDLFINSNAINISIIGKADIVKEELDLTIGAQPLQTVDKIVNRIPVIGWLLTGKDKDLVTASFEAKGKWSDPEVKAIPVKSLGKGIINTFFRVFELPVKLFTDTGEVLFGK